jgi:hypothetical protein
VLQHETLATFLDDANAEIKRWQRFMILVTLVLTSLLTSIWFYSSRAQACCAEIRGILGCDAGQPCHGIVADCGDLQTQFIDVQGPYTYDNDVHMYLDDYGACRRRAVRELDDSRVSCFPG